MKIGINDFDIKTHNGMVTIQSVATGEHRTFRISTCQGGALEGKRVVSLLRGPNREDYTNWTSFAFVGDDGAIRVWKRFASDSLYSRYATILANPTRFERTASFLIEGQCRRCNRPLTHPESIKTGLGPVCAGRADSLEYDEEF